MQRELACGCCAKTALIVFNVGLGKQFLEGRCGKQEPFTLCVLSAIVVFSSRQLDGLAHKNISAAVFNVRRYGALQAGVAASDQRQRQQQELECQTEYNDSLTPTELREQVVSIRLDCEKDSVPRLTQMPNKVAGLKGPIVA